MKINIASLNVCTFHPVPFDVPFPEPVEPPDRKDEQSFNEYIWQKFEEKKIILTDGLSAALDKNKRTDAECLFFTLPEFFWNISPYAVWHEEELAVLADFHNYEIKSYLQSFIKKFPESEFGKIILLPGTAGSLHKVMSDNVNASTYTAYNCIFCVNNFSNPEEQVSVSVWPKTNLAGYDYGYSMEAGDPVRFKVGKPGKTFIVDVKAKSASKASHENPHDSVFYNDILSNVPFMISLCADYHEAVDFRMNEWLNPAPKIHFLLACAMTLNQHKRYPLSVQYSYRNDGFAVGNIWQPIKGMSELKRVEDGVIVDAVSKPVNITDCISDDDYFMLKKKAADENLLSFYTIEVN